MLMLNMYFNDENDGGTDAQVPWHVPDMLYPGGRNIPVATCGDFWLVDDFPKKKLPACEYELGTSTFFNDHPLMEDSSFFFKFQNIHDFAPSGTWAKL